jgi:hypothetical protein
MREELLKLANDLTEVSESKELAPQQTRLIKTCIISMLELSQTQNEDDFFNTAKDLFQNLAAIMKHSHFQNTAGKTHRIPYAEQAIELSIEILSDELYTKKLKKYDQ